MPEEVVPIVVISVLAFTGLSIFVIHTIFSFLRERAGIKDANKDKSSLTTSELEGMLRRVVQEANAPLLERIETLEDQIDPSSPLLELPEAAPPLNDEFDSTDGPRDLAAITKKRRSITE